MYVLPSARHPSDVTRFSGAHQFARLFCSPLIHVEALGWSSCQVLTLPTSTRWQQRSSAGCRIRLAICRHWQVSRWRNAGHSIIDELDGLSVQRRGQVLHSRDQRICTMRRTIVASSLAVLI